MKTYTVAEALQLDNGMPVPALEGKIIKIFPRKTGTHTTYGDWSVQNFIIADPDGNRDDPGLFVMLKNADDISGKEFYHVRFESFQGKKGMAGITRNTEEYNGQVYEKVIVTVKPIWLKDDKDNNLTGTGGQPQPAAQAPAQPAATSMQEPAPNPPAAAPREQGSAPQNLHNPSFVADKMREAREWITASADGPVGLVPDELFETTLVLMDLQYQLMVTPCPSQTQG